MKCSHCGTEIPLSFDACPACGTPAVAPSNVRIATRAEELDAIDRRYDEVRAALSVRGCEEAARRFEEDVGRSAAVLARPIGEVDRLASSNRQLYATYDQAIDAELRVPDDDTWEPLRLVARDALFPRFGKKIRFAALSLDGRGLGRYGQCFVTLKEGMIAHRATVFEENSAAFIQRHGVSDESFRGRRARWQDRNKLAVIKHGAGLRPETRTEDHASILLRDSYPHSADDDFIEVHIHGPMNVETFERILIAGEVLGGEAVVASLREKLEKYGVALETSR